MEISSTCELDCSKSIYSFGFPHYRYLLLELNQSWGNLHRSLRQLKWAEQSCCATHLLCTRDRGTGLNLFTFLNPINIIFSMYIFLSRAAWSFHCSFLVLPKSFLPFGWREIKDWNKIFKIKLPFFFLQFQIIFNFLVSFYWTFLENLCHESNEKLIWQCYVTIKRYM